MAKKKQEQNNASCEDWIPVEKISNGFIHINSQNILEGKQIVTGVRIEPKNIFILNPEIQARAIMGLRDFYNTFDFEFWLICCDRPVDINLYKSELEILFNNAPTPQARKLILQDLDKCEKFIGPEYNTVDTEFYILFKDQEKNIDRIQKRLRTIIQGLAASGLNSRQITDDDARVILDSFFNDSKRIEFGTVMADV